MNIMLLENRSQTTESRLIKKLHYCWFGYGQFGEKEKKCIESWKRFLPDFEIIRWDESNFDLNSCKYVKEAYEAKKWAFVSDYARFKILHEHGGLYLDTDVEIIRPPITLLKSPFMGIESDPFSSTGLTVNPGLGMYAVPFMPIYEEILLSYESDSFKSGNGQDGLVTVVTRTTEILKKHGLRQDNSIQNIAGITIYPSDYLNPKDYETGEIALTENAYSIHHYSMSWFDKRQHFEYKIRSYLMRKGMQRSRAFKLGSLLGAIRYCDIQKIKNYIARSGKQGSKQQ